MIPILRANNDLGVELLVVDNGSSDNTQEITEWYSRHCNYPVRHISEPRVGLSHCRNRALAEATGTVLVFLDDDALPTGDWWLEMLCRPVLEGTYAGVTGKITLPPHLLRPWMTDWHRLWMSCTEEYENKTSEPWLIGANMAIRTEVARTIPGGFHPLLDSGALGYGGDTLFCHELLKRGHRIGFVPEAEVLHCMDPARLTRRAWLSQAVRRGRSHAYQDHLFGKPLPQVGVRRDMVVSLIRLWRSRVKRPGLLLDGYRAPVWELHLVAHVAFCRAVLKIKAEGVARAGSGGQAAVGVAPPAKPI